MSKRYVCTLMSLIALVFTIVTLLATQATPVEGAALGFTPTPGETEEPTDEPTDEPTEPPPTRTPQPPSNGGGGDDPSPTPTPVPVLPASGGAAETSFALLTLGSIALIVGLALYRLERKKKLSRSR
jgi:hypothetical protein